MYTTRQVGSLAVVEQTIDRKRIEAELQKLDDRLFLDAEVAFSRTGEKQFVWTVKEHIGSAVPPHLVLEWRDERGNPLPLTFGIIEAIRPLDGAGHRVFKEVDEHNRKLKSRRDKAALEAHEEIARDMLPRISDTRSAVLHRGQHLRMSRDKRRSKGWKV